MQELVAFLWNEAIWTRQEWVFTESVSTSLQVHVIVAIYHIWITGLDKSPVQSLGQVQVDFSVYLPLPNGQGGRGALGSGKPSINLQCMSVEVHPYTYKCDCVSYI